MSRHLPRIAALLCVTALPAISNSAFALTSTYAEANYYAFDGNGYPLEYVASTDGSTVQINTPVGPSQQAVVNSFAGARHGEHTLGAYAYSAGDYAYTRTFSAWDDEWTFSGGTGTGTATLTFNLLAGLDASGNGVSGLFLYVFTAPYDVPEVSDYHTSLNAGLDYGIENTHPDIVQTQYSLFEQQMGGFRVVDSTLYAPISFTYGETLHIRVLTGAYAYAPTGGSLASVSLFDDMLTLTGISLPAGTSMVAASGQLDAYNVTSVPEPRTWAMCLSGLIVLFAAARRRATTEALLRSPAPASAS